MAEFHFFGNHDDSLKILEILRDYREYSLLIDKIYQEPTPEYLENDLNITKENYRQILPIRRVFVLGKFSRSVVLVRRGSGTAAGTYYIKDDTTHLDLSMPACFKNAGEDVWNLNCGNFSYHSKLYNCETCELTTQLPELKEAYSKILKRIKKYLKRHKLKHLAWVGPSALEMLNKGEAKIIAKYWV